MWHRLHMRFLRFFIVLTAVLAIGQGAFAQDKVSVRTGSHETYSRLVFEWPSKPSYSLSKEGGRILVRFAKTGAPDVSGVSKDAQNIKAVETLSKSGEALQVAVSIPDGSTFRDFVVENKLILDVYNPAGAAAAPKKAETKPEEKKPAEKVAEKTPEKPVEIKSAEKKPVEEKPAAAKTTEKGDFSVTQAPDAKTAPVGEVEAAHVPPPKVDEHVISMTSTYSIGMAAFERAGYLWIVLDTPDLPIKPEIMGPQKEKFGTPVRMEIPEGVAYRVEIPQGMIARGEGGGLTWRLILSDKAATAKPVFAHNEGTEAEAKLVWPLKSMRKVLTFTDPIVGDKVMVVTSSDSKQYTGSSRNYVNLKTLDSVVGLAFTPKSDDLKAELSTQNVSVSRPGGLAVSTIAKVEQAPAEEPAKEEELTKEESKHEEAKTEDAKPEEHKTEESETKSADAAPAEEKVEKVEGTPVGHEEKHEAVEQAKPEDITKTAAEKPSGNNIYNFARWEMGGIEALRGNQRVLMAGVASKPDEQRTEDIITMAKLNIANNRAPEALGLLRVGLNKVPELEDNEEFMALRGAALALAGKYDEAILDFSREGLKKYDDVKYWRAYALGGLEDWNQAIESLPADMAPIAAYPKEIRTPLSLMFAEIKLRGAKIADAQSILKVVEKDLPKLSLPYQSAWKYLAGEAERQSGKAQKAEEYWEPLVKNGKDDLYRAKAGLSLTKLQLDEKKIKPAEAINRLEGLRYAWRGDELETLINYRLGQMYIDNKDYLKGLTVLRNATTLSSPNTEIGKNVRGYMSRSFSNIFASDALKNISPLESISIYEEFKDLAPTGEENNKYVEKLAERLVDADLLGRAAALLEYQVNNRLKGDKKAETAIRLAAIRLLDGNPDGALRSLEIAQDTLNKMSAGMVDVPLAEKTEAAKSPAEKPEDKKQQTTAAAVKADPEKQRQVNLLKARALSLNKKPDEALTILEAMTLDPDVNKLRTDIAWGAGKWEEAAMSLGDLIISEDISSRRPLTEYQTDLILNRGIALSLSGNRVALANLRDRYNTQMKDTTKGKLFEIVSRPRRPDMIGSREAIESMMSEIDLFQGFVDSYAKIQTDKETGVKTPAAPKEAVPADAAKPATEEKAEAKPSEKPATQN